MSPAPPPRRPRRPDGALKRWFGRTKRRLGYYELRNRLREPRFREALRATDVFLVGHPKSGNTWLAYMIALLGRGAESASPERGDEVTLLDVGRYVPYVHGRDHEISGYGHLPDPRVFRNEYPRHQRLYPRILYVVRDPRAVLVSFWHMFRVMFDDRDMDLESFVEHYMKGSGPFTYWNKHLVRWDRQVRASFAEAAAGRAIHIVRYEDLVQDRPGSMSRVASFLGHPAEGERFQRAVELGSFEAMRGLEERHGAEAYEGRARGAGRFVRRGRVEGWRGEMDPAIAERVERELEPAMREAGYL